MSTMTTSQHLARLLMVFGLVAVLSAAAVGVYTSQLVRDVYDQIEGDDLDTEGNPVPARFDADEGEVPTAGMTEAEQEATAFVKWQDVMTITPWQNALGLFGLASLLTSILLTFRMSIFKNAEVVQAVFPRFWQAYLAGKTGKSHELSTPLDLARLRKEGR